MASNNPPPSAFPPSMGPGGQVTQNQNPTDFIRQIQEMRKFYSVAVESTTLNVAYKINGYDRRYSLPFDAAPLSGFQQWLLYGGRVRATISGTFLLDMLRGAENMIGRPLTQREAEGFMFHSGKRMRYGFLGMAAALGGGYGMAAWGYKIMKFPFRQAKPLENYDVFPMKRVALLTGPTARAAWQTTRFNLYAALGIVFLGPLFRGMGESVMGVGLYRDERTRETVKAIKGGFDRIRMNRRLPGSEPPRPQAQSQDQSTDADSGDLYGGEGSMPQSQYGDSTNYSGDSAFSGSTTDTGALSDSAMRQRESSQTSPINYGGGRGQQYQDRPQSSNSSTDFFFDDASPTAGNNPDMSSSQQQQRGGYGNAGRWARIRQGGSPSSGQTSNSQPEEAPQTVPQSGRGWNRPSSGSRTDFETKGDSFSFSSSDEQRALAKEQAQRDFDAMLDRERQESGSGDYARGSFAAEAGSEGADGASGRSGWDRRRRGGS